jgi:hypothetical protein
MAKSDYVPTADNDFLAWLDNFIAQADARRADLGLSEAALSTLKSAGAETRAKSAASVQAQAAARHATEEKKASRRAAEASARAIARQIKAGDGYTEALGALLGIVGPEDATDLASLKPVLTGVDQTGGVVVLSFPKLRTDGINIYEMDETTGKYAFLARDTVAPYVDNRPLRDPAKPELRRYTAVYVVGDEEVGQYSDELVVNCAP